MLDMMKKLQEAKKQMDEIKGRLETIEVEGKSPKNEISVTINGNRVIKGIRIDNSSIMENQDELQASLVLAVNDAISKADQVNESEMRGAAGAMMPGLGGLFK